MRGQDDTLIRGLQAAAAVAILLGVAAILSPAEVGRWAGWAMVGVLIGAPVLRVLRLVFTWRAEGDRRFTRRAALLLLVLAGGAAAAGTQVIVGG